MAIWEDILVSEVPISSSVFVPAHQKVTHENRFPELERNTPIFIPTQVTGIQSSLNPQEGNVNSIDTVDVNVNVVNTVEDAMGVGTTSLVTVVGTTMNNEAEGIMGG